ncbi:MAG: hypothetical protein F4X54_07605 [Chloroflexi bacterium]|nr:hypothetical protein [Chloroflexota bacterium]
MTTVEVRADCTGVYAYAERYQHLFEYAPGPPPWRICLNCGLIEERTGLLWPPGDPLASQHEAEAHTGKVTSRKHTKRLQAAELLLGGENKHQVAAETGLSYRTVCRVAADLGPEWWSR